LFFLGVGVSTILTFRAFNAGKRARDRFRTGLFGMVVFVLGGSAFAVWGADRGHVLAVIVGIVVACPFPVVAAVGWLRLRRGETVQ
jgi:predicted alpha/beta-fold hydrolase